ncbi:serpin family protein [bacterium]|nr:serpin family protein [bacterium]
MLKRNSLYITALLLVLLLASACLKQMQPGRPRAEDKNKSTPASNDLHKKTKKGSGKENKVADDKAVTPQARQQLSAGINQFGFRLYEQLRSEDGNIFMSPYSLATAIGMVFEGAGTQTAAEIQSLLQFPELAMERRAAVASMYNALNPKDASYSLSTANGIWSQQDFSFLPDYLNVLKVHYCSQAASMDFRNNAESSRQEINKWVADRTNDRIKDLFQEGVIRPDTKMVLANAIYFKGRWARQFDPKRSFDKDFRAPSGPVKAKFMIPAGEEKDYLYFENDDFKAIELPYEGSELAMLALLPKQDELGPLEAALNPELLAKVDAGLRSTDVIVQLPRFTFKSKFELNETLAALGMPTAFSDDADFSGMTGGRDLKIGAAVHQAFVEVNEEGTEAAAASGIVMRPTGAAIEPISFIADHPFIFLIRDKQSGVVLFMGRLEDPTA